MAKMQRAQRLQSVAWRMSGTSFTVADTLRDVDVLTLAAWVYPRSVQAMSIIETFSGNAYGISLNSNLQLVFAYNGMIYGGTSATAIPRAAWTHVAVTFHRPSGQALFYINGALVLTSTASVSFASAGSAYRVGAGLTGSFVGHLAEPVMFSRVLTPDGIYRVYRDGVDAYPPERLFDYRLLDGVSADFTRVRDSSSAGNHGTGVVGTGYPDPMRGPRSSQMSIASPSLPYAILFESPSAAMLVADAALAAAFGVAAGQIGASAGVTIGLWAKKYRFVTPGQVILSKGSYPGGTGLYVDTGGSLNAVNPNIMVSPSTPKHIDHSRFDATRWTHVVAGMRTDRGKIWRNGVVAANYEGVAFASPQSADNLILAGTGTNTFATADQFIANRYLTDEEVWMIYSAAEFPQDVIYFRGPDETGTKLAAWRGGHRLPSCDVTLIAQARFSPDTPWGYQ